MKAKERGAALLAVLLLVAVTGAIAAAGLERLRLSRALSANAVELDQARALSAGALDLAVLAIEDMVWRSPERTTLEGGWNGAVRRLPLPGGDGEAALRVRDGGNCFNLNSLVQGNPAERLERRERGIAQFAGLMVALGVPAGDAGRVAAAAADWADSDSVPGPAGAEDEAYLAADPPYRASNSLFDDPGELRAVAGVTPELYARVRPWLCALPVTDLSPLNFNTLLPDQAPLLAMLAPGQLSVERARRAIERRPSRGWGSQMEFWRTEALSELDVPLEVQLQPQMRTSWFALDVQVRVDDSQFAESALVDARLQPSKLIQRRWGE